MRVSGLNDKRDDFEKLGLLNVLSIADNRIEKALRKEFGKDCLVYIEHAYQIPRRGKGGFKAYNLEHQIQTYLKSKNVRWIFAKGSSAGKSEWFY